MAGYLRRHHQPACAARPRSVRCTKIKINASGKLLRVRIYFFEQEIKIIYYKINCSLTLFSP